MEIGRLQALLRIDPLPRQTATPPVGAGPGGPDFGLVLKTAVERVENDQRAAAEAARKLAAGQVNDIAEVTIASERANLSLGLALQVRNKMLEAYQEIMRMPL